MSSADLDPRRAVCTRYIDGAGEVGSKSAPLLLLCLVSGMECQKVTCALADLSAVIVTVLDAGTREADIIDDMVASHPSRRGRLEADVVWPCSPPTVHMSVSNAAYLPQLNMINVVSWTSPAVVRVMTSVFACAIATMMCFG